MSVIELYTAKPWKGEGCHTFPNAAKLRLHVGSVVYCRKCKCVYKLKLETGYYWNTPLFPRITLRRARKRKELTVVNGT